METVNDQTFTEEQKQYLQGFAAGTWGGEFHPEFGPRDGDGVGGAAW